MRGVVIALGLMAAAALPASAQRPAAEIALIESAAPASAVVLGDVRAEIHQMSLFAKAPARDLADKELRAQAAKLGADAVVDIKYESSSPLLSKKGLRATGKAVKFNQAPVQVAAAATPAASPSPTPEPGRTATFAPPAEPAPSAVAQPAAPAAPIPTPAAPAVLSPRPAIAPAPAPPGVVPRVAQQAPVAAAAASAAPRGPTPEALIVLTQEDLAGRTYDRLGEVQAEARQTSLFPKKPARVVMDEQLRAKAAALGADAVILIKYESYSPLLSKKGASAAGIAVKYR